MNPGEGRADGIDLRLLRYFLTLAEELHFTRAAQRLFVSQPALSNQIQRLERAVGVPLFARSARGVALTAAGHGFLPYAQQALAALKAGLAAAAPQPPALRVDVLDAELSLPREVLKRLRAAHHGLQLTVTAEGSVSQRRRILAGDLDAGFCGLGAPAGEALTVQPIATEPVDLIVATGHRLARDGGVALSEAANEVFYLPHDALAPEWREFVLNECRRAGFEPALYPMTTASAASALDLVAEGECVTLSLRSTALPEGTERLRLVPGLTYPWAMVRHRDRGGDAALGWLIEAASTVGPAYAGS
ncbi:LysR family transcriptional regulator [Paractinoplanes atraurantiacus]|uniref:DNA-binding transcriptional regulator, LysR family n=1 Tax=Paractinoplanes atraurantiacus TaxID=1036182 RepID=A0A285J305_9ACTN|nr:LysR family transcriptional regulator [Actinoplanes atraurantiacus]SNY54588.1 DNA-binding transcriptional regulator, LysR family [Actinoplanes atraurantiacus]